jgi:hypothetical protein
MLRVTIGTMARPRLDYPPSQNWDDDCNTEQAIVSGMAGSLPRRTGTVIKAAVLAAERRSQSHRQPAAGKFHHDTITVSNIENMYSDHSLFLLSTCILCAA